jgi:hypothetical protein
MAVKPPRKHLFLYTERRDAWWAQPLITFVVFTAFVVYTTWALLQGEHYTHGPYLSPFYSPELFGASHHAWFGPPPSWWPNDLLKYSPAFLILPFPLLFRMTCYYYRGAYYKAFWADPIACSVGEPRKTYWGENSFPLIIQNIHRYALLFAIIIWGILTYDAILAFRFPDGFGIGVGTIILVLNVVLIALYTFGCHSLRHFVGGRRDTLPKSAAGKACYDCVSGLNRRHAIWAWCSLFSVAIADIYIRLCSMGIIHDWRIV